jgi:hypothetical protein
LRSEKPSPPIEAMVLRKPSPSIRKVSAAVCHPLEASPPSSDLFAASSSRWKGKGSNSLAKEMIMSFVTLVVPRVTTSPIARSS